MEGLIKVWQATAQNPYMIQLNRLFFGKGEYQYTFRCQEAKLRFIIPCEVTIQPIDGKQSVTNKFKLVMESKNQGTISCNKLGQTQLRPGIRLPITYQTKTKSWIVSGPYDMVRSLFMMREFQHTISVAAALPFVPQNMTVTFTDHDMGLTCYGPLGMVLNQSHPFNENVKEEEDEEPLRPIPQVEESSFLALMDTSKKT